MKRRKMICALLALVMVLAACTGSAVSMPRTLAAPQPVRIEEADGGSASGEPDGETVDLGRGKMAGDEAYGPKQSAFVTKDYPSFGPLGSASEMQGVTLIVTIQADDLLSSWGSDTATMDRMLSYQGIATRWLTARCAEWGVDAKFIYDWKENPDLFFRKSFDEELVRYDGSMYNFQKDYLVMEIPVTELMSKYAADNVIFMFFFNTGYESEVNPWTISYKDTSSNRSCNYELMNIYVKFDDVETPPSTIAHEMLHCFGAPDLYYANELISQEYVDYCVSSAARDIMFTVTLGDTIIDEFTELDAYYVGLTDYSSVVTQWNLGPSQHLGY